MNAIEKAILRHTVRPKVLSDDGERLVLTSAAAKFLPGENAREGIERCIRMLPGVEEAAVDSAKGLTVSYNIAEVNRDGILQWVDTLMETALNAADTRDMMKLSADEIEALGREALTSFRQRA